jgi:N-acyl-phosphatidylethanolamine-hydrolysing phospholipase D
VRLGAPRPRLSRGILERAIWPIVTVTLLAACLGPGGPKPGAPAHHRARGFANLNPAFERPGAWMRTMFILGRLRTLVASPDRVDLPRADNDGAALRADAPGSTITWIGHSTLLVQLDGVNLLTDPHWSDRASPVSFAGPLRLNPPGLAFEDLPPIHAVVISHSHYDHLDRATVTRLAEIHRPRFLVPLGLKAWFASLGIDTADELDWWESREIGGVTVTCLPVQHWSSRTLWDEDRTLWAGWALAGREKRMFFGGDSGYYDGFREIGARLGPFDLAAVAIGAYAPPWMMRMTHTTPEEALGLSVDLRARRLVAMHWGTFVLSDEPIDEPPRRLRAEARRLGLDADRVWILAHGETRSW